MPSHDHCCVPLCTNRRDKSPELSFHTFPQQNELRKPWLVAIRRDEGPSFKVTANTVVCSAHFVPTDYGCVGLSALPKPDASGEFSPEKPPAKRICRPKLKPDAVPSIFPFKRSTPVRPSPSERSRIRAHRQPPAASKSPLVSSTARFVGPLEELPSLRADLKERDGAIAELTHSVELLKAENAMLRRRVISFQNVMEADPVGKQLEFLTGFSRQYWDILWKELNPSRENVLSQVSAETNGVGRVIQEGSGRKCTLPLEDELLMTLMRLRLNRMEQDLAYEFGIHQTSVSRIFTKWINYMFLVLGDKPLWPSWEEIEASMPTAFKNAYPTTFCIIDATELHCEVPSSLSLQSQHYSSYKSHTTKKGLVGIAPNGAFIFFCEIFSGAVSDRQITIESGFLDLLKDVPPGKCVMADRGFDIQDLLLKENVMLNIPAFKGSKSHLKKGDVVSTQKIARLRIHVERAIGQVKQRFHILDGIVPLSSSTTINQIWTVCCLLSNFAGPLLSS